MSNEKSRVFWKTNAATLLPDRPPKLNLGVGNSSKSSNPVRQNSNTLIRNSMPQFTAYFQVLYKTTWSQTLNCACTSFYDLPSYCVCAPSVCAPQNTLNRTEDRGPDTNRRKEAASSPSPISSTSHLPPQQPCISLSLLRLFAGRSHQVLSSYRVSGTVLSTLYVVMPFDPHHTYKKLTTEGLNNMEVNEYVRWKVPGRDGGDGGTT